MRRFLEPGQKITGYSTIELLRDIKRYVSPYKGRFFVSTFLRILGDIANLYPAYALAMMVTIVTSPDLQSNQNKLWTIVALWIGLNLMRNIFIAFAKKNIFDIGDKVQIDVEQKAITHLFSLDIAWHEKENTGNTLKRINTAASGFARLLRIWIMNVIEIIVNFVGIILILYTFDKTLGMLIGIFLFIYFVVAKILIKYTGAASYNLNVMSEEVVGLQYEAVNNIRTVKIMSMTSTLIDRLRVYSDQLFEKSKIKNFWLISRNNGGSAIGFLSKATLMIFVIYGIIQGRFEVGLLILVNGYFNRIWESIDELSNVSEDVLVSRYAISRLKSIMNEPIKIDNEDEKKPFPNNWKKIELKDVSFSYGENDVLNGISFDIIRGERIGIIGLSGAGKSTLFKLLLKEYEDFEGEILVDGIPIQEISKRDYFTNVAVVLQETEVFNFSLRENIYLAGPGTQNKEAELQKALEIAHVTEFLPKLPDGVDTAIGEKGVRLSGGEKQRLGIARAVYKNPQLLLLDEATSHLDLESEEKIQDSLHKFFRTVTAVVIAHRLTTIKEMDKIIVIEDGEILESGNFAQLTAQKGRFYELWEKQRL